MKRKLLSVLLALSMTLTLLPMTALADEGEGGASIHADAVATYTTGNDTDVGYAANLAEAVSQVNNNGTVTLLKDCSGKGLWLAECDRKTITINFNKCTYTVTELVGSSGTENQAAHFEKNNTVKLMNGTLKVADSVAAQARILIQNYCDLTAEKMTLDGRNLNLTSQQPCTLSNNDGAVKFKNCTVYADERENAIAVDAAIWGAYAGADVTLENCTVYGTLDTGKYGQVNGVWTKTEDLSTDNTGKPVIKVSGGAYTDIYHAVLAAEAGTTIKLAGDVTVDSTISVDKTLTIDLNGHEITGNDTRAIHVKGGTLTLTGTGVVTSRKTSAFDPNSSVIRVGDNNGDSNRAAGLILEENVRVDALESYGVSVFGGKTTETVTVKGKISAGVAAAISGNGSAGYGDTTITIEPSAEVVSTGYTGIYHPQVGTLIINGGIIKGLSAIESKSGDTTIAVDGNPTITATGDISHDENNNGMSTSGYAIAAVNNKHYAGSASVTINSGTYTGLIAVVDDQDDSGRSGTISISGGTFNSNPSAYVASGHDIVKNSNETYTVVGAMTKVEAASATCTAAGNHEYWAWDGNKYNRDATNGVYTIKNDAEVTIPANGHSFSGAYVSDETHHWHKCSACNADGSKEAHNFGDWTVTKQATYTEEGERAHTCTVCKRTETETIAKLTPSSSGSSSSGSTTTKTETTTNPDGSTTKTETKSDGTVIETTTGKDGSTTKTETKKDGSSVTESKDASGSTGTVKTDKDGKTEAETKLSSKAVEEAKKNDEAVKAPVEVEAGKDSASAPTVKIDLPGDAGETKVEIPVSNVSSGTVAVIVHPDGTEEIVKTSVPTENGVILNVEGGATVKIIDNSRDFIDTRNHWSREEVNFVASRELFNGIGNNLFGVSGDMTRGMVNTVLARLAGEDTNGGANWYDKGTEWAKKNGITDGTNPTANVTREQLATMLYRFAGSPKVSGELSFADADQISGYAKDALLWAVQNGILNGIGNNLVAPGAGAERAQVAAMMARYLKNVG